MIALSRKAIILLLAAFAAVSVLIALVLHQRPPTSNVATTLPAAPPQTQTPPQTQAPPAIAALQAETKELVAGLGGTTTAPDVSDGLPTFDIARIEPGGDSVIAGRAAPGVTVELLRNGEVFDRIVTDSSGQFAMVPPKLPPGNYNLNLRVTQANGQQVISKQSVAVALAPQTNDKPVVALMTPDKPTIVLSQPAATKQAEAGTIVVETVELQDGGKLHVSGRAKPGATARFYLNDSFLAAATAGADGRFAITINEGVAPGKYRVRLDEVEPVSGAVRARAEVPFNVPPAVVASMAPAATPVAPVAPSPSAPSPAVSPPSPAATSAPPTVASKPAAEAPSPVAPKGGVASAPVQAQASPPVDAVKPAMPDSPAKPATTSSPGNAASSNVVIPRIATATVARGDSLWAISQLTYGAGIRYAVIYEANQKQIRDPDLIYPGQIFVLPAQ